MTDTLDAFVTAYRAPKVAPQPGVYPCIDWVRTGDEWAPCGNTKTQMWGGCPNEHNHGRPVLKPKTLDEITEGDRVIFYHHASNQDQHATVLAWTPAKVFPSGKVAEWDAVLHIEHLALGNGFSAGIKVQCHRVGRYGSIIKYATDGSFQ